jgi:hypothetical protein
MTKGQEVHMSRRFTVFSIFVLSLAACSPGAPSPSPPPPQSQSPTPQQPAPDPAAPQQTNTAPTATTVPASETAAKAAAPAATEPAPARTEPAAPPAPKFREVIVPAGTLLNVRLITPIASDTSNVEDAVRGSLIEPLVVEGVTAVPDGVELSGTVRDAKRSGRVKGRASVAFRFERLNLRDERLAIRTAMMSYQAAADRGDDVKKGAIGGAAGAIVGGIVGGGKGAAIGAGVGATGAVVATRGDEVRLDAGTRLRVTLQEPLKVIVPLR